MAISRPKIGKQLSNKGDKNMREGDKHVAQHYDQGFNDRLDERLAMTGGPESEKKMDWKNRREISKATRKPKNTYGFNKTA